METWELWFPAAAANGLLFARSASSRQTGYGCIHRPNSFLLWFATVKPESFRQRVRCAVKDRTSPWLAFSARGCRFVETIAGQRRKTSARS